MAKNILIFSDGTGQAGGLSPDENISNIYKLFRATRCGPDTIIDPSQQLTFYDPGLGSRPDSGMFLNYSRVSLAARSRQPSHWAWDHSQHY
jgi:uncharacterized protein (DUF2235 family)